VLAKMVVPRRLLATGSLAVVLAATAACTSDAGRSQTAADSAATVADGTVIQPRSPGEQARTLAPGASVPAADANDVDVEFVRMMIPHHAQAVEMGRLAETRARDPQVRSMARRIADAQRAEIAGMSGWLHSRGLEAPAAEDGHGDHGGHDDDGESGSDDTTAMMPGMLSPAEMDRLAAAEGRRFDELYLRGMIRHHQGAVDMAGTVMDEGSDTVIGELATDISAGQTAEIDRLRDLLRGLPRGR